MNWSPGVAPGWPDRLGLVGTPAGVVGLRPLRMADGAYWRRMRLQDEALIRRWDPTSDQTWEQRHSRAGWAQHRSMMRRAARRGAALPFAVTVNGKFAGQVTIGGIQRFPLHSGWVGYWVSSEYAGQGVATVGVALLVSHAFGPGRLHRVEASVAPANQASQRVLEHVGFRQEGLLRRYLDIDGEWRDHQLWALTAEEAPEGPMALLRRWSVSGYVHP